MKKVLNYTVLVMLLFSLVSCEKEITVDLPASKISLVVEASINQQFPALNYVFISQSLDYFNPSLSLNGVGNAVVYITPGTIFGNDTIWNDSAKFQLFDASSIPLPDTLLNLFKGVYVNPLFTPQVNVPYKLDIDVNGQKITGTTLIPNPIAIDTLFWKQEFDEAEGDTDMFVTFEFTDGPEQNNYRMAVYNGTSPFLVGWGSASFFRTFDDAVLNNGRRPYSFFSPFDYGDTLSIYLNSIGRKEFLFWESYARAANNGGPFATPVAVKSNITGAIGSFTGYGVSYRNVILK